MDLHALAELLLALVLLVHLAYPVIARRRKSVRPAPGPVSLEPVPTEALPDGHKWPEKFDEFDGVMERFVCRDCGMSHLRRRV